MCAIFAFSCHTSTLLTPLVWGRANDESLLCPHPQTLPSTSKNIEWKFPAETDLNRTGDSIFPKSTVLCFSVDLPSWPCLLCPHVQTSPFSSSNRVW